MPRVHWIVLGSLFSLAACRTEGADAYGNFEATEVTVSAEASGRVVRFDVEEGTRLAPMAEVGLIDTVSLALQHAELQARRDAARARLREVDASAAVLETQRVIAQRELERTRRLLAAQAATAQQEDRAEREARVLGEQLQGTAATRVTVGREVASIEAQMATLADRVRRSRIVAPLGGTVLARFVEAGEFVQVGTPLFKMAALDTLVLRAYLSGEQLALLSLGEEVQVRVDSTGGGVRTVPGRVTWISSSAEFTPTPIQTREERTTQVYAVKVAVPNVDGRLRLGMPGEVVLATSTAARTKAGNEGGDR